MSGYLKISALALFMLIASAAAMGVMKDQEMEEKIIEGIKAMREAEKALDVKSELLEVMELIKREECFASGQKCSRYAPQYCCSGSCVPHPRLRIFVCE